MDSTGTIVLVNRQLERQFGYAREELIGQSVDILLPEALRPAHAAYRQDFMSMTAARTMGAGRHLFGRRRDGSEFPLEISLTPLEMDHGLSVLAAVVDISARVETEQAHSLAVEEQLEFERLVAELSAL